MPTTTETKLKISADDRELKKLAQTIPQAFDKRVVKEFQRASKDVESQLAALVRKQVDLTRQLEGVKRGTSAYKDLSKELKGVRSEADMVSKSLGQIDQLMRRQEAQQRRARGPGFVAGMGQGLGVAQYIPTGPQMVPRMAGAMMGGMMRRGAGIAAAPFRMPGIGGLAQGLSGIPIIGGFLGGAVQQAAGAYQAAVGFDQARLQNLQYAGREMGQLAPMSAAHRNRFLAAEQEMAAAQAAQEAAGSQQGPAALAARRAERRALARESGGQGASPRDYLRLQNQLGLLGRAAGGRAPGAMARTVGIRGGQRQDEGLLAKARDDVSKAVSKDREAAEKRLAAAATALEAARKNGGRMTGLSPIGMGTQFGIMPEQTQAMLGQFFQQRGGLFNQGGRSAGQFQEALAAMTRRGVTMQQAGGFARMGMAGGGGAMGGMNLSEVLANATKQGLEGSQVTEFLGQLVTLGARAEKMGVKIDVREFVKGTAQLTAAGLQGVQAQRVAGGLQQAGMGVSQRGVQGPMDVLMARAAGFDPSQGAEGYAKAMNKLSGGMTSEMMNNLLGMVTQGVGAGGFGPEMQRLMFRRAMSKMGVQVGPGQASAMIEAYKQGKAPSIEDLTAGKMTTFQGKKMTQRERLIAEAAQGAQVVGGAAVGAAGLQVERIGIGKGAAGWVQAFERNAMESGRIINQFGEDLKGLSAIVGGAMQGFKKMTEGGVEGLVEKIVKRVLGL